MKMVIMGSGTGTNFDAIHQTVSEGSLSAQIALVISDKPDSLILSKARNHNYPIEHILAKESDKLLERLLQIAPDYIILAGYMRILSPLIVDSFPEKIINIHPSLLPKYPGIHAPQQAIEAGEIESGCTVHFVDTGVDTGQIIAQARVPILPEDTKESLHARIQDEEHKLLPEVLMQLATY
ncbi:MAG: phosphoribosylglycinamide formyltransferase [Verrucomicrobiota bacterium]|nr:phosphoribosylglycinamide formyltransferase [Verrucomicrobiota bacterium]